LPAPEAPPARPGPSQEGAALTAPRRRRWPYVALAIVLLIALDVTQPPEKQLSARALIGGIRLHRSAVSPWMPLIGASCRFEPSCSHYAEVSIRQHGALIGSGKALARLARCGPWTPAGSLDPPG
jgi:putative membrane protein insertion efficiency factor